MTNNSILTAQVAQILDRLCSLPDRKELSVETKRYPRLLPAESGAGFEQKFWSFNGKEWPRRKIAIPADAEDVVVTWKGGIDAAEVMGKVDTMMGAAASEMTLRASWSYEVLTQQGESEKPQVVVRVFRDFSAGAVS
ncbi:MAG: hypothetical protein ABSH08_17235 [Tepidisphaeraceae bacterium]|jgi:hypothetical protein